MKPSILSTLILSVCLAISLIACQKKSDTVQPLPKPQPLPNNSYLKHLEHDADNYLDLKYTNGDLTKLVLAQEGQVIDYEFTYNAAKKPVEALMWGMFKVRFLYTNERLQKLEYINVTVTPNVVEDYVEFKYDNNNRLVQSVNHYSQGSYFLENAKTSYTYYSNGDVRSMSDSIRSGPTHPYVLISRREFAYDIKLNPVNVAVEIFYMLYLNHTPHNVTNEVVYNENNQLDETKLFQYEYNAKGLPAKAIERSDKPGKPSSTKVVTYAY